MQVTAIYDGGTLHFSQSLHFKHQKFEVLVNIPEDEVVTDMPNQSALDALLAQTPDDAWLQRMKAIETRVLAIPDDVLPDLTAKQLERIEAFEMREDR